ncbi:15414_t:CDS:2, partial [Entrophospora sp. SA101]
FEFKGPTAYTIFRDFIHPALRLLNLPNFQKFSNYQIRAGDYEKFAHQAKLPWNKEINKYALGEEAGEKIRAKISSSSFSSTLSSEDAMARYADY